MENLLVLEQAIRRFNGQGRDGVPKGSIKQGSSRLEHVRRLT